MCGEKDGSIDNLRDGLGSPPHVRGKDIRKVCGDAVHRITPACAGKSFVKHVFQRSERDHPRMCGEKASY